MVQQRGQQHKRIPWTRVSLAIIALLLFAAGGIFWILNSERIIQGEWSNILPVLFTVVGTALAFLAWLFPFSPEHTQTPRLPLARELVRGSFRMGDNAAANFPYITAPIQKIYNVAKQALLEASSAAGAKRGMLILGESNAGKTRLAFEALIQTLPHWSVLRWRPDYTVDKLPTEALLHQKHLVIFIDDLQDYVPALVKANDSRDFGINLPTSTIRTVLETVFQHVQRVVVVATCRQEDEATVHAELGVLFNNLAIIRLHRLNVDLHDPEVATIIAEFQRQGATHVKDWDGTLGSLVLGLSTKNQEYLKLRNVSAGTVLRAIKLLTKANTQMHTERRLRTVCAVVFGEKDFLENEKTWQEAVSSLTQKQFVTEEVNKEGREVTLVIRKETYVDQVITDYPIPDRPHQLEQDFKRLQGALFAIGDTYALLNLGAAFGNNLKRYEEALATFEQALLLPNDATASSLIYYSKGNTLTHLKRITEALAAYEEALRFDPNNSLVYGAQGLLFSAGGFYEEALAAHEQALRLEPNEATAYLAKGFMLATLERHEEALAAYEQALRLEPNYAAAYAVKGSALAALRRYEEALAAYEQALRLEPNEARVYFTKGNTLYYLRRYKEALAAYEQALHFEPDFGLIYVMKGKVLVALRRYKEGLAAIEQALQLDLSKETIYFDAYFYKGVTLFELARYEEALAAIEQALQLDHDNAAVYYCKGIVLAALRRYEEALTAFEQALQLNPKHAAACYNRGRALLDLLRYEEALAAFEQALRLDPNDAETHFNRGSVFYKLNRLEEALTAYEQAFRLDRNLIYRLPSGVDGNLIVEAYNNAMGDSLCYVFYRITSKLTRWTCW